jgi:hypothetical protein
MVRRLLAGDGFQPGSLPNMTLFSHIAWGAAACAPFDCSDQTLRMVTIAWGAGGALLVYALLRLVQATPPLAVIGTLSITLNPLYLELSNSFMTDVPFTGMFVLAAICFMRDLRRPSTLALAAGTFISCSATLSRQIGLAAPLSFLICTIVMAWLRPQAGRLGTVIRASVPIVACLAAFIGFETWLSRAHGLPPGQAEATMMLLQAVGKPLFFVYHVASQGLVAAPYLGWFLAPVLLLVSPALFSLRCRNRSDIAALGLALVIGGLIIVTVIQAGHGMPLYRNVIIPQGLGPLTLHDVYPYGPGTLKLQPIAPLPWQV